jgi:hypothetical protein
MVVTADAILREFNSATANVRGTDEVARLLRDPVHGQGIQFHLGGKAGTEQPEDREKYKEEHRQGEKEGDQFPEKLSGRHHCVSSGR